MKKAETLVGLLKIYCNGIGILQGQWVRLKGSFLPNDTLVCKVTSGMSQSLNSCKGFPKKLLFCNVLGQ